MAFNAPCYIHLNADEEILEIFKNFEAPEGDPDICIDLSSACLCGLVYKYGSGDLDRESAFGVFGLPPDSYYSSDADTMAIFGLPGVGATGDRRLNDLLAIDEMTHRLAAQKEKILKSLASERKSKTCGKGQALREGGEA